MPLGNINPKAIDAARVSRSSPLIVQRAPPQSSWDPRADVTAYIGTAPINTDRHARRSEPTMSAERPPLDEGWISCSLPTSARTLQGLFFYHTRKVGLVVGAKWGSGFLITRLGVPGEEGPVRWSAPVFFRVHEGSIGLTAGTLSGIPSRNQTRSCL